MMAAFEDLRGQRFGRLVGVAYVETNNYGHARFLFQCDCGEERVLCAQSVKHGFSRSCGCLRRDSNHARRRG